MLRLISIALALVIAAGARADDLLESYDANVMPEDAGFVSIPCDDTCSASLENGHLVLRWIGGGELINYTRFITSTPPGTFWVEWRFRSNTSLSLPNTFPCDADFAVRYDEVFDMLQMMGDWVVSFDGSVASQHPLGEFRTYRFESLDGLNYRFFVDGQVFVDRAGQKNPAGVYIQMLGSGGCIGDETNEWDFVRWGEIAYGEQIVSSDPPAGVVNAAVYPNLDRFTVTFDQPNYVLVDEITVNVTSSATKRRSDEATEGDEVLRFAQNDGAAATATGVPQVVATRRLDNGPADTVEIVLDGPLPLNATTTFTFSDGAAVNVVAYTYVVVGACCTSGDCTESGESECGGAFTAGGTCEGDADGDSVDGSCGDGCPSDAGKLTPGQCGCGTPDIDSDEDSVADCLDQCDGEDDTVDEDDNGTPDCAEFQPIPTTTAWGIGILSLLLLIAAKIRTSGS